MGKKYLNPYKMHRHWEHRMRAVRIFFSQILNTSHTTSRRDYSWAGRAPNPYTEKPTRGRIWQIIVVGVSGIIVLSFLVWHPVFTINHIAVQGTTRIHASEIEQAGLGIMVRHRWLVLPGRNYFLVNLDELQTILTDRFSLAQVNPRKKFPNGLSITIVEKKPAFIYDNGHDYSYVDDEGSVIEVMQAVSDEEWHETVKYTTTTSQATTTSMITSTTVAVSTSTAEIINRWHEPAVHMIKNMLGPYPIIYDTRGLQTKPASRVLTTVMVEGIQKWSGYLNANGSPGIAFVTIENELGAVVIKTREGWVIKARLQDHEEQINRIAIVLKDARTDRRQLRYIDVRYSGRVYWQ